MSETVVDYEIQKANNLSSMVSEYEAERSKIDKEQGRTRSEILSALHLEGLIKMHDFTMEQDDMMYEMDREAHSYYRAAFENLVEHYKPLDTTVYKPNIRCTTQKLKKYPDFKKHQLKQIVNAFNHNK